MGVVLQPLLVSNEITLGQQLNSSGMLELSFKNKAAAAAAMQALIHPAESATALLCDSLQLLPCITPYYHHHNNLCPGLQVTQVNPQPNRASHLHLLLSNAGPARKQSPTQSNKHNCEPKPRASSKCVLLQIQRGHPTAQHVQNSCSAATMHHAAAIEN